MIATEDDTPEAKNRRVKICVRQDLSAPVAALQRDAIEAVPQIAPFQPAR